MVYTDAAIKIQQLRLRTYIGFNPEELEKRQDVVIDAEIYYPASKPCETDDEMTAVDYKVITKAMIQHVEEGRFKLLEKLTADLLEIAMENTLVSRATVTVAKPHALRFADSVSVSLSAKRN